jgi:hypothetical protein
MQFSQTTNLNIAKRLILRLSLYYPGLFLSNTKNKPTLIISILLIFNQILFYRQSNIRFNILKVHLFLLLVIPFNTDVELFVELELW